MDTKIDDIYSKIIELNENIKLINNIILLPENIKKFKPYIRKFKQTISYLDMNSNNWVKVDGAFPVDETSFAIKNSTSFELFYTEKKNIDNITFSLNPLSSTVVGAYFSELYLKLKPYIIKVNGTINSYQSGNIIPPSTSLSFNMSNLLVNLNIGAFEQILNANKTYTYEPINITGLISNGYSINGIMTLNGSNTNIGSSFNIKANVYDTNNNQVGILTGNAIIQSSSTILTNDIVYNVIFNLTISYNSNIEILYTNSPNVLTFQNISYGSVSNITESNNFITNANNINISKTLYQIIQIAQNVTISQANTPYNYKNSSIKYLSLFGILNKIKSYGIFVDNTTNVPVSVNWITNINISSNTPYNDVNMLNPGTYTVNANDDDLHTVNFNDNPIIYLSVTFQSSTVPTIGNINAYLLLFGE